MLVLRLLLMVLTIICLMDGHGEVLSSNTGIRNGGDSPAVKPNEPEELILDRKKKPKKSKKPGKGKGKGKKAKAGKPKPKPKPAKTTTTTSTATTAEPTTSTETITTTATATTTTTEATTSTATKTTTTPTATTTEATTPTTSTITTTPTKTTTTAATTSSPPTTAATTANSGPSDSCYDARDKGTSSYRGTQSTTKSGRTCQKWTEQKPHSHTMKPEKYPDGGLGDHNYCRRPYAKGQTSSPWCYTTDKKKRFEECGIPFCQTCVAKNKKPCLFPFRDGNKEYNECADYKGKYFWCATSINSAGKYTKSGECPEDGSCPLPPQSTTPVMTPTTTAATATPPTTTAASTTPLTTELMENKVVNSLKNLVKEESKNDTLEMLQTMNGEMQSINEDLQGQSEDNDPKKHGFSGKSLSSTELSTGDEQGGHVRKERKYVEKSEFVSYTVSYLGTAYLSPGSSCCSNCKKYYPDASLFEYWAYFEKCWCYKKGSYGEPRTKYHNTFSTGECESTCDKTRELRDWTLECPVGYIEEKYPLYTEPLYILQPWYYTDIYKKNSLECAKDCESSTKCKAFQFSIESEKCQLLSNKKDISIWKPTSLLPYPETKFCKKLPDCDNIREFGHFPSTNACLCNGNRCPDEYYCNRANQCVKGLCSDYENDGYADYDNTNWKTVYKGRQRPEVKKILTRIKGGSEVKDFNRWPWMASIHTYSRLQGPKSCGGVLVGCQYVLTAAHCIMESTENNLPYIPIKYIEVFLKTTEKHVGTKFSVIQSVIPETKITSKTIDGKTKYLAEEDIAILMLDRPIRPFLSSDEGIRPIALPQLQIDINKSTKFWFAGFGRTGSKDNKYLQETSELKYLDGFVDPRFIIYEMRKVKACAGDSGSPAMIEKRMVDNTHRWYLFGIMSSSSMDTECTSTADRHVGEMMNVHHYDAFMKKCFYESTWGYDCRRDGYGYGM